VFITFGEPADVEEVADPLSPDADADSFVQEYGSGCMVVVKSMGRVFLGTNQIDERLEHLGRGEAR